MIGSGSMNFLLAMRKMILLFILIMTIVRQDHCREAMALHNRIMHSS